MSNRGRPKLATADDDRCEAATVMTEWKKSKKLEERCPFMAKWSVGSHQFCMHHTRMQAVALGVEKGFIKRLVLPQPIAGQRVRIAK